MKVESVTEHMLFSTVRLEAETSAGTASGTGFIFSYRVGDNDNLFIVTNKHVISDSISVRSFFTQGTGTRPLIGHKHDFVIDPVQTPWYGHPDPSVDVAILPLQPILQMLHAAGQTPFFRSITHTSIPEPEEIEELDPLEQVIFLGYPAGLYDTANLTPIFRRGMTATPPQLDYCGRPTFLIDASVFGGSSGSPVFLDITHGHVDRRGQIELGPRRTFLLGILAEVHCQQDHAPLELVTINTISQVPVARVTQMIDLGVVFKASLIVDTVEWFLRSSGTAAP
jgi:hypothetical protein